MYVFKFLMHIGAILETTTAIKKFKLAIWKNLSLLLLHTVPQRRTNHAGFMCTICTMWNSKQDFPFNY